MTWNYLSRFRRRRDVRNATTFLLVVLGPVLAFLTFIVVGAMDLGAAAPGLRLVLLADLIYVLAVAALVFQRIARMVAARRARSAGSRLHLRLTGVFALMALLPAATVAVFAVLTINMGLEAWFSTRVSNVVGSALSAAKAYEREQIDGLVDDIQGFAFALDSNRAAVANRGLRSVLSEVQVQIQRGLREAYVIDGTGAVRARGDKSYLFDFEAPGADAIIRAGEGGAVLLRDYEINELRALIQLQFHPDRYLYVTRDVDGELLRLLDETTQTAQFYRQQESERGRRVFEFGLIYLGFVVLLILAAVWLGMWFAERLSRPVGRLASAAQRVGTGNLDVRVVEEEGDDEIAMLGRYFNQMTRQLKGQRDTLLDNTRQIEGRRRMFDSVLSSVTSGVVGLNSQGKVAFVNRSAWRLLDWKDDHQEIPIGVAVPEFGALFDRVLRENSLVAQEEIKVTRNGKLENLLVRVAPRRGDDGGLEGYVVAFDDVTDLVSAQRLAAWGDVARRIAHEIKNPLTPIQLSAERIRRKYARHLDGADAESLEQLTEVIVRQTNDLRRIVDEFSKFARMPEPERRPENLRDLVQAAALLQEGGQPGIRFDIALGEDPLEADLDATMIGQALTNLIKNAGEAIETLQEKGAPPGHVPIISIRAERCDDKAVIRIADNGVGLPTDRNRLFEPYVTTRDKGTGLGLPIVKKIVEEHGGTMALLDAPLFGKATRPGAMVELTLPLKLANQEEKRGRDE